MTDINSINDRTRLGQWLNENGLIGSGAEIGCAFGGFARIVLSTWRGKQYFMVDPWIVQDSEVYRERTSNVDYRDWYHQCVKLSQQDRRVKLIRSMSVDGSRQIADDSLDWVFIDGNHSYRSVLEDMDAWYRKVKPGGLFSGHDYGNDTNWPHFCEVKSAVDRWMSEHHATFSVTSCSSWWSVKPLDKQPNQA